MTITTWAVILKNNESQPNRALNLKNKSIRPQRGRIFVDIGKRQNGWWWRSRERKLNFMVKNASEKQ